MFPHLIGTKSNMTHVYNSDGVRVAATKIKIIPSWITKIVPIKEEKNVQLGYSQGKHINKAQAKIIANLEINEPLTRYVEFRTSELSEDVKLGQQTIIDVLNPGDVVDVQGVTKGKGFAGVVKRWGFHGGPKTHGQSDRHRAPGSIGMGTTMGRVFKGKKMGGKMGTDKKTVSNLVVLGVNNETQEVIVSGSLPGANGSVVYLKKTGVKKNFISIPSLEIKIVDPSENSEVVNKNIEA